MYFQYQNDGGLLETIACKHFLAAISGGKLNSSFFEARVYMKLSVNQGGNMRNVRVRCCTTGEVWNL